MENRNYFYEFKNLVDNVGHNGDIQLYGVRNRVIEEIDPRAWGNNLRATLNTFSGNLVIISKEHSSNRLETILRTYGVWAIENIHEDMDIGRRVLEWNNYGTNEKKELTIRKFQIILQGQLIVLCGTFPDMAIDLDTIFGGAVVDAHPKFPYNMIAIIKFLLNHASQRLSNIEADIFIKCQNCSITFPLRSAYCNSYLESKRSDILELQEIFLKTTDSLQIMRYNLRCYCTSNTPRGTIELLKAHSTRRYNDSAIVIEKMHNIAQALQENRKKMLKSVKKKLRVIYSAVGSMGTGIFFIVHSENTLVEKYVKLVTSCIVLVLVLLDLFIVVFVDKWKIKCKKEDDLEANVEATIPWWLRIRIWLLSIVVRMLPRNIEDITNRIRSA